MLDFLGFLVDLLDMILFSAARKKGKDAPAAQPECLLTPGVMLFFSLFHVLVGTGVILLALYVIVQREKQLPLSPALTALLIVLSLALIAGIAANIRLVYLAKKQKAKKSE